MSWDPSQFKLSGYEIPEYGGAGFAALICVRCAKEILGLDEARLNELEFLPGWSDVFGFERAIEIAKTHRCEGSA